MSMKQCELTALPMSYETDDTRAIARNYIYYQHMKASVAQPGPSRPRVAIIDASDAQVSVDCREHDTHGSLYQRCHISD
jgi:hypothetical protein